ncbi:MAG TPA: TIGR04552 family protein, partial [Polyangiaceae bacterium]|nr:TIGR04552 family protein [Polyangiaceae bacterium]
LLYLSERLFPFNYVVPGESINTILRFRSYCEARPFLEPMLAAFQTDVDDGLKLGDNSFSDRSYRVIHFVVDLPVRLPAEILDMAPPAAWALGPIIFVLCEFQLIDQDTEAANEFGDASHARYKERQKAAVMRRLKIGARELFTPPGAHPAVKKIGES